MPTPPALLEPVTVRKPWGREVWYSGIEARGESRVHHGGERIRLSQFLATLRRDRPVTLLKTLHPDAGNLYVEVHERKYEVYIVDEVDAERWPEAGQMLLGASVERGGLGEAEFRERMLAAARAAEASCRVDGVAALMRPVPLAVGDAVAIAPRVPHSLLRGVSVVEFQTPVFERKILAASQRVATQAGWDSAEAVDLIDLEAEPCVTPRTSEPRQTLGASDTFTVTRHRLGPGDTLAVPPWSVGWVVDGVLRNDDVSFAPRSAWIASEAAELGADADCETLIAHER